MSNNNPSSPKHKLLESCQVSANSQQEKEASRTLKKTRFCIVVSLLVLGTLHYFRSNIATSFSRNFINLKPVDTDESGRIELQLSDVYVQHLPEAPSGISQHSNTHGYSSEKLPFLLKRWSVPEPVETSSSGVKSKNSYPKARVYDMNLVKRTSKEAYSTIESHKSSFKRIYATTQGFPEHGEKAVWGQKKSKTALMLEHYRNYFLSTQAGARTSYWKVSKSNTTEPKFTVPIVDTDTELPQYSTFSSGWKYRIEEGLLLPNVTHKSTLLSLARMAANAYIPKKGRKWETVGDPWEHSGFGWSDDGLRGHVFATRDKKVVVLSFKGTSASIFANGDKSTSAKDRFNDNRLFSCCCAQVDFSWTPVCGCNVGKNKCKMPCLQKSLIDEDLYLYAAAKIFLETAIKYPNAYILLTGHSLGGSVASLLGLTFGIPTVAFQAPGELLAAKRLRLPLPPRFAMERLPTWHIGHNSDPIYMGSCNGQSSICYFGGYAMESKCHLGQQCVYDTEKHLNWDVDIRHHRIVDVIYYVLEPWGKRNSKTKMPVCQLEKNCSDCGNWNFVD